MNGPPRPAHDAADAGGAAGPAGMPDADLDIGAADAVAATLEPAELRDLDPPEREAVVAMLHRFGDDLLDRLESEWTLKVLVRADIMPHRRVIAVDRARLADLAPHNPIHVGIPVAHLARQGARLTLEGGRLVAAAATRRVVRVGDKGETLFLYGRHLLVKSVRRVAGHPKSEDPVIVVADRDGRYLGLGIATEALAALRGARRPGPPGATAAEDDATAVRHQADLGLYLRAQQEVPQ